MSPEDENEKIKWIFVYGSVGRNALLYDRNYFPQKECNDNSIIYCSEEDINHYNIIRYGCAKDFVFSKSKNFTTAERCFMINNIFNLQ